MADFEIEGKVTVKDEASRKLDDISGSTDKLTGKLKQVATESKGAATDFRGLTVGLSGVATSAFSLYNAYDRVADMQLNVDRANLRVKTSANMAEDAQRRQTNTGRDLEIAQKKLADAIATYGADSEQAAKATDDLNKKLSAYDAASADAKLSTEKYDLAVDNAKQTQDNFNEAIIQSAVQIVPTAITLIDNIGKVAKSFSNLRDFDFSVLLNKLTGKGGIADSIGATGGATDILSGKLSGLNNISFSGVIGALGAVTAIAVSTKLAIDQVNQASTTQERITGKEMSAAEKFLVTGQLATGGGIGVEIGNTLLKALGLETPDEVINRRIGEAQDSISNYFVSSWQNGTFSMDSLVNYAKSLGATSYMTKTALDQSIAALGTPTAPAYVAAIKSQIPNFAKGFEGVTAGPTAFLAGEAGAERVSITPMNRVSSQASVTAKVENHINIANVSGSENLNAILEQLKRAVQTGTDRGLTDALNQRSSELSRRG